MQAIVKIGSFQYKVSEGETIETARINEEAGKDITLEQVLMYAKGNDVRIGQPYLTDIKIQAKVIKHTLGDKVTAFKYKRRKNSAVKKGHRRKLTALNIKKISA